MTINKSLLCLDLIKTNLHIFVCFCIGILSAIRTITSFHGYYSELKTYWLVDSLVVVLLAGYLCFPELVGL